MKNSIFIGIVLCLLFSGCSQTEAVRNTFNATECYEQLLRYSNNDDNLSCREQVNELKKLQADCAAFDDENSFQALIDQLEATEDCMEGN
ncbi:hypothetical protein [Hyunsoonleella rubra]|uniref:Lipoprotein n=1 Tax=Hyunsoonleella rubra TaxID=1737062 RepID=A0ABW5TDK6_9FLAO